MIHLDSLKRNNIGNKGESELSPSPVLSNEDFKTTTNDGSSTAGQGIIEDYFLWDGMTHG